MKPRVTIILLVIMTALLSAMGENNIAYTLKRAEILKQKREYAASSKLIDSYLDNCRAPVNRKDSVNMIKLLRLQGDNFYKIGVTTKAADLYEQALRIAEATGSLELAASLCNELFIIHFNSGNTALSKDLLHHSLALYRSIGDKTGICKLLNNLAIFHYKQGDYDNSVKYYKESLEVARQDPELMLRQRPTILSNLAETYQAMGDYKSAALYLKQATTLHGNRYDNEEALQAWLNMAGLQAATGNREGARAILRNIGNNIDYEGDPFLLAHAYGQLASLHLLLGDSLQSFRWELKAKSMADSLHTHEENEQLRQILVRYNAERIAEHNRFLELNVRRHTVINYIMVALVAVILAFLIFLIYKIRLDRKKNRLIRTQKEQLMEFERKEHERKEREYQEKLDHQNRQLTSYSIDAASISELHKILLDSLRRMRAGATPENRSEINDDIALLQNFNRTEVNDDFRVYFNEVHPDLLKRLSEKFPALTPNDLRLCSYLYLGMSTKEIASLTFREIRSVESSRLRLRKKLGISGEQTLHDFLHSV